ncbi:hypothetical protein BASA61_009287 [Batrachochytrium salamandrivorans]|nr:hypothetical protein BASA62_001091 [Batrachochytrium salamandrivorans]KAH6581026.1 hypothetical protein BASA61_009287 [Batrachochytrium salamandrivorans]
MDPCTLHQETLYLVARFLSSSGFNLTSATLENEIHQRQHPHTFHSTDTNNDRHISASSRSSAPGQPAHTRSLVNSNFHDLESASALQILPSTIDINGNIQLRSYSQLAERYSHTQPNELLHLVQLALTQIEFQISFPASLCSSIGATSLLQLTPESSIIPNTALKSTNTMSVQNIHPIDQYGTQLPNLKASSITKRSLHKLNIGVALSRFQLGARYLKRHFPSKFIGSRISKLISLRGHLAPVYSVIFDCTGTRLVTGGDDALVKVWSVESGWLMETIRGHQTYLPTNERVVIIDVALDHSNKHLATAANDNYIRIWNFETLTPMQSLLVGKEITTITFSPSPEEDNQCLLVTCVDSKSRVYMWDTTTQKFLANPIIIQGGTISRDQVTSSTFNRTGTKFATGGTDGIVYLFSILSRSLLVVGAESTSDTVSNAVNDVCGAHPKLIKQFDCHKSRIADVTFSNRGDRLLSGSKDGCVVINRFCTKTASWTSIELKPILVPHVRPAAATPMPPTDPHAGMSETVTNDSTPAGETIHRTPPTLPPALPEMHALEAYYLCWNADDSCVIVSYAESRTDAVYLDACIKVYDSIRGDCIHSLKIHKDLVIALSPHPLDNRILLSTGHDGIVVFWDIFKGTCIFTTKFPDALLDSKFSPDGSHIALVDMTGAAHMFAIGASPQAYVQVPEFQFFAKDWKVVKLADQHGGLVDEEAQLPAHLVAQGPLLDQSTSSHPASLQNIRLSRLAWIDSHNHGHSNSTCTDLHSNVRTKDMGLGAYDTRAAAAAFNRTTCIESDLVYRRSLLEEERQWIIFEQRYATQLLDIKLLKKRRNQIVESDNEGDDLIADLNETNGGGGGGDRTGGIVRGPGGLIAGVQPGNGASAFPSDPLTAAYPIFELPDSSGDEYVGGQDDLDEDSDGGLRALDDDEDDEDDDDGNESEDRSYSRRSEVRVNGGTSSGLAASGTARSTGNLAAEFNASAAHRMARAQNRQLSRAVSNGTNSRDGSGDRSSRSSRNQSRRTKRRAISSGSRRRSGRRQSDIAFVNENEDDDDEDQRPLLSSEESEADLTDGGSEEEPVHELRSSRPSTRTNRRTSSRNGNRSTSRKTLRSSRRNTNHSRPSSSSAAASSSRRSTARSGSKSKGKRKAKRSYRASPMQLKQRSGNGRIHHPVSVAASDRRVAASPWVSTTQQAWSPYLPQIGDTVAYIKTGHRLFIAKSAVLSSTTGITIPHTLIDESLPHVSFGQIVALDFDPGSVPTNTTTAEHAGAAISPDDESSDDSSSADIPVVCRLTMALLTPRNANTPISSSDDLAPMMVGAGGHSGGKGKRRTINIAFCDLDDLPDFLILFDNYVAGCQCRGNNIDGSLTFSAWRVGDRAVVRYGIEDYHGVIHSIAEDTDDPWDKYTVQFDGGASMDVDPNNTEPGLDTFSAWEMRPVDAVLPFTEQLSQQETDRILALVDDVLTKDEMSLFSDPVPYDLFPTYLFFVGYPMWLNQVRSRLLNGFYRRIESVVWDIERMKINASLFNESDSTISVLAEACFTHIASAVKDIGCFQLEWCVSSWIKGGSSSSSDGGLSADSSASDHNESDPIDVDDNGGVDRVDGNGRNDDDSDDALPGPSSSFKRPSTGSKRQIDRNGHVSEPSQSSGRSAKRQRRTRVIVSDESGDSVSAVSDGNSEDGQRSISGSNRGNSDSADEEGDTEVDASDASDYSEDVEDRDTVRRSPQRRH